jgi:hypothetical protein
MKIPHIDFELLQREFSDYALSQAHPLVKEWREKRLLADIAEETRWRIALLTDSVAAHKFAEAMRVLKLPPEHYMARLIDIQGQRYLAQINFSDTSGSMAFVGIYAASVPPGSLADNQLMARIADEFRVFSPKRSRFYHSTHAPLKLQPTKICQHFLAAPVGIMVAKQDALAHGRVSLQLPKNTEFYPSYVDAYNQMYSERPELKDEVRTESEETLEGCLKEGLLYEIIIDGTWAGIIAARRQLVAGVRGIFMVEILLCGAARGQGLASVVHKEFSRKIVAIDPEAVVTGTIAAANSPSLKAALRAGRVEIGTTRWFELETAQ